MSDVGRNTVQSVAKAFGVLRAFAPERSELTITEVAGLAGLDRGTAFRMIHTMVELGLPAIARNLLSAVRLVASIA